MSDGGPSLDFQIRVNGAPEAQAALNSVGDGAQKAASATGDLGKGFGETRSELREFARSGHETREIIEGISRAGEGGASSIMGVATAFRGFLGLLRTSIGASGPIGLAILGIGALVGVLMSLRHHGEEAGEGLKKAGEGADEAKEAFERFKKDALDQVDIGLKEIKEDADEAIKKLKSVEEAELKHSAAQLDLDKAKIEANPNLSPEQKKEAAFEAESAAKERDFKTKQKASADQIAEKAKETQATNENVDRQQVEYNEAANAVARHEADLARKEQAQKELNALYLARASQPYSGTAGLGAFGDSPEETARRQALQGIVKGFDPEKEKADIKIEQAKLQVLAENAGKAALAANNTEKNNDRAITELKGSMVNDAEDFAKHQQAAQLHRSSEIAEGLKHNKEKAAQISEQKGRNQEALQRATAEKDRLLKHGSGAETPTDAIAAEDASVTADMKFGPDLPGSAFIPRGRGRGRGARALPAHSASPTHEETPVDPERIKEANQRILDLDASGGKLDTEAKENDSQHAALIEAQKAATTATHDDISATRENTAAQRENTQMMREHMRAMAAASLAASSGGTISRGGRSYSLGAGQDKMTPLPVAIPGTASGPFTDPASQQTDQINQAINPG